MPEQPTNGEIIGKMDILTEKMDALTDMVHGLAVHMDQRFDKAYADMATKDFVERRLEASEERIVQNLGGKIDRVDTKVDKLVDVLEDNGTITEKQAKICSP